MDDSRAAQDMLELRCLTDCEGLYATKTYGISNNWFDGITSTAQVLYSTLKTDLETGELVVCRDEGTPANNIYVMDSEDFPTEKPETPPRQLGK